MQNNGHFNGGSTGPRVHGRAWCETYGDFVDWLNVAGVTVATLPGWDDDVPVRVVAVAGGRLFVEQLAQAQFARFRRMVKDGQQRVRALTPSRLRDMEQLHIVAVDVAKLARWQEGGVANG